MTLIYLRKKYLRLLNNLELGVYTAGSQPNDKFINVNKIMPSIFGVDSKEEMMKYSIEDFCLNAKEKVDISNQLRCFGFVDKKKLQITTSKGEQRKVKISICSYTDEKGNLLYDGVVELMKRNVSK